MGMWDLVSELQPIVSPNVQASFRGYFKILCACIWGVQKEVANNNGLSIWLPKDQYKPGEQIAGKLKANLTKRITIRAVRIKVSWSPSRVCSSCPEIVEGLNVVWNVSLPEPCNRLFF